MRVLSGFEIGKAFDVTIETPADLFDRRFHVRSVDHGLVALRREGRAAERQLYALTGVMHDARDAAYSAAPPNATPRKATTNGRRDG